MIKVLICGDRNWDERIDDDEFAPDWIDVVIEGLRVHKRTEIIEGCCPSGADKIAHSAEFSCNVHHFAARWDEYGRAAGPKRNQQMLDEGHPDVVFAFHNNLSDSKGTKDMVSRSVKAGVPTYLMSRQNG